MSFLLNNPDLAAFAGVTTLMLVAVLPMLALQKAKLNKINRR
jgi:hypothetical protein